MSEEEIKEYLKRVEQLEEKLVDEEYETLQWLIFGYNECAKLLYEKEQQKDNLLNWLESKNNITLTQHKTIEPVIKVQEVIDKIKEVM